MHVLQRTIDKVNGYIYGISDEAKEAYMMSSEPLQPAAPAYVGALLTPYVPHCSPCGALFSGGVHRDADLLVREHYDEERIRDRDG